MSKQYVFTLSDAHKEVHGPSCVICGHQFENAKLVVNEEVGVAVSRAFTEFYGCTVEIKDVKAAEVAGTNPGIKPKAVKEET